MFNSTLKRKAAAAAASLAAAGMALTSTLVGNVPAAHADPKQFSAFVGVGSDTIQDVFNAFAGSDNGINYTPITSSSASGSVQVTSWNATGTNCITPKAPGATINRPNGSGAGLIALSRAIDSGTYGNTLCGSSATGKATSGLIDFGRSSAGPTQGDLGTDVTYVPFGRDGVSFAYYANGVATPVTSLTRAQLTTIYTTGTAQVINGVTIVPCGIQAGSGTFKFWNTVTTANTTQEAAATNQCNTAGNGNRIEENTASSLKAKGDALVGDEVIVGFSAAQFIAQTNGAAVSTLVSGVDLGSISDDGAGNNIGKPYTGTSAPLAPNTTFYNDGTFGRNVYVILDSGRATGAGNNDIKSLFVGSGSTICGTAAQATVNTFGFETPSNCGVVTIQGSLAAAGNGP